MITCVVQNNLAETVLEAAKNSGAQGATINYARGTGVRENGSDYLVLLLTSKKK